MIITPSKEKLIVDNFIERSFENDSLPSFEKFEQLNSADQYYLASNYNWDDGIEVLNWIIDSKKCDKGTALLIFWNADPSYYAEFNNEDIQDYDKEIFNLLQKIISKIKSNGFKNKRLKYLPSEYDTKLYTGKYDIWNLPQAFFEGNKGFHPLSLSGIQSKIWEYKRQRRLKKRASRKKKN